MRANLAALCLSVFLGAALCSAQATPQTNRLPGQPGSSDINCSGVVTDQKVSDDLHLISGEESNNRINWSRGDYVYINHGQDKGVRVGDRFTVIRPQSDPLNVHWFKWQSKLLKAMGTAYVDAGQLRVVRVDPKVSIAEVTFSCGFMQRGDIVLPYEERPAPPFKDAAVFDHFAPVSGKPVAMVVAGTGRQQLVGRYSTVYVNLGTKQGVKVGDYFRIFRYQGSMAETAPQNKGYQYKMFGFGSAPARYEWNDLPREILGEGIVISASTNSSTMMITYSTIEIYAGDYIEVE